MMKKLRSQGWNPLIAIALAVSIVHLGCKEPLQDSSIEFYTGQDYFNAVFFAQGPLVERLPVMQTQVKIEDLFDKNTPMYDESLTLQKLIMTRIETKNKRFFEEFAEDIRSRDHVRIRESLSDAAQIYVNTIVEISRAV